MSLLVSLVCFLLLQPSVKGAEPSEIAELFPSDPVFYLEISRPGEVIKELESLLKGSTLENILPLIDQSRSKVGQNGYVDTLDLGFLGTLLSPEMLKEAGRFRSFAFAVFKKNKQKELEWQMVLLPGESQVPGLMMKYHLATAPQLRKTGTELGVDLYQDTSTQFEAIPYQNINGGIDIIPPPHSRGSVMAYVPGSLLFASSKETLVATIRRLKGKEKANFSTSPKWKASANQKQKSGLFFLGDAGVLMDYVQSQFQNSGDVDSYATTLFKQLQLAKSFTHFSGSMALSDQGLNLEVKLEGVSLSKNSLFSLFQGQALSEKAIQSFPKGSALGVSLAFPEVEKRSEKMVTLADLIVKASGTLGLTPSEAIKAIEEQKKIDFHQEIGSKMVEVSLLLPKLEFGSGIPIPSFAVQMSSQESATQLEKLLTSIFQVMSEDKLDPVSETVEGVKIFSLSGKELPFGKPVHFGREALQVVVGWDRKAVAQALKSDASRSLPVDKAISDWFREKPAPTLFAFAQPSQLLQGFIPPEKIQPKPIPKIERPKEGEDPPPPLPPKPPIEEHLKALRQLILSLNDCSPTFLGIASKGDSLTLRIHQPLEKSKVVKSVNFGLEWYARRIELQQNLPVIQDGSNGPIIIDR